MHPKMLQEFFVELLNFSPWILWNQILSLAVSHQNYSAVFGGKTFKQKQNKERN